MLPLAAFDDAGSATLYSRGEGDAGVLREHLNAPTGGRGGRGGILRLLLERAVDAAQPQDVRKLSAELAGRMRVEAVLPAATAQVKRSHYHVLYVKRTTW